MARDRYVMRKLAQGYQAPLERNGCRTCGHCLWRPKGHGVGVYSCKLGAFFVAPGAICNHYTPHVCSEASPTEKT